MKFLFTILFLLAFPALVLLYRQHFLDHVQRNLAQDVRRVLSKPGLEGVKPDLNYMDVTLQGLVPSLEFRLEARELVDALPGVRCREPENLLMVKANIQGDLAGTRLTLKGWLHHSSALGELVAWLDEARPGLEISSQDVHFSSYVTVPPAPQAGTVPEPLQGIWPKLQESALLQVDRDSESFQVSGRLPTKALHQAVLDALPAATPAFQAPLEKSDLKSGAYVRAAAFADDEALPGFLAAFFAAPGAMSFFGIGNELVIKGDATPATRTQWLAALGKFPPQVKAKTQFNVVPSVYHFANYQPESRLPRDQIAGLRDALRPIAVMFGPSSSYAPPAEAPALDAAAEAILMAGPGVKVLVCSLYDANEGTTFARRRADSTKWELMLRGVPEGWLEGIQMQAVEGSGAATRRVEFLIK